MQQCLAGVVNVTGNVTWFCLALFMSQRFRWEILGLVVFNANNLGADSFHVHLRQVFGIRMNQIPKSSRFVVFLSGIVIGL